jgi:hypothetical protein
MGARDTVAHCGSMPGSFGSPATAVPLAARAEKGVPVLDGVMLEVGQAARPDDAGRWDPPAPPGFESMACSAPC